MVTFYVTVLAAYHYVSLILGHLVTASMYDVYSHVLLHLPRTGLRVLGMHGSILKEMKARWIHMNFA
jgi:hypothetical protein